MLSGPLMVAYLHAVATAILAGVIWFVQVVHYPLFRAVGPTEFTAYELEHKSRVTLIVGPAMLLEAATAVYLVAVPPPSVHAALLWAGLALVVLVWLTTFFVQVPQHARLSESYDEAAVTRLIRYNWVRTAAWTVRLVLALAVLHEVGGDPTAGSLA